MTRFAGGANLVVWKHTRHADEALELVHYLTSPAVVMRYILQFYMLPPRLALLSNSQIESDPVFKVMAESVRQGKAYYNVPLWGLIEDRLIGALAVIYNDFLADPTADVDEIVRKGIEATARRLNLTLSK